MRRVIDDSKLNLAKDRITTALRLLDYKTVSNYDYGTERICISWLKRYIGGQIADDFMFGDTKHAHGIGNNNAIEIIYTGNPDEQQICGYLNLIDNMFGCAICYITDIDGNNIISYGKLNPHYGWDRRF